MQKVTIKQDGIYFAFWQEESTDWVELNINDAEFPLAWYLTYPVQMEDGITLRSLLTHLSFYKDEIEKIFTNVLFGVSCDTMHDLIVSKKPSGDEQPINFLYLFKIGEVLSTDDNYDLMRISPVIMGIYLEDEVESDNVYHLSSIPIEDWLDLPISIDNFMEYVDTKSDEILLSGMTVWQFFEIIHTILAQVSLTLRITETLQTKDSKNLESGPMTIIELFNWIHELDKILLIK